MAEASAAPYRGSEPLPSGAAVPWTVGRRIQTTVTALLVAGPFAGLAIAVWQRWGHGIGYADMFIAAFFYLTGLGVTVGFHRLLAHRSFTARPWLRTTLAIAGSMSCQGNVIEWAATHQRHHAFTDRPGDPHSPYRYGAGLAGQLRGLLDAHLGWLFRNNSTSTTRYLPDLLADPAITRIAKAFPALCALSLPLHDPPAVLARVLTLTGTGPVLPRLPAVPAHHASLQPWPPPACEIAAQPVPALPAAPRGCVVAPRHGVAYDSGRARATWRPRAQQTTGGHDVHVAHPGLDALVHARHSHRAVLAGGSSAAATRRGSRSGPAATVDPC